MKTISVELVGKTPLLQHRMNEEALFQLLAPKSKKKKNEETPETPREIASKHAYRNPDGTFFIPAEYIAGAFQGVASDYSQKNSQRKSYKGIAKAIFRPTVGEILLLDESNTPIKDFEVDVRKATNHQKGAIAVCRPRFDKWKVKFDIELDSDLIDTSIALQMLQDAGRRSGIGSFRVAKGGYFGQFEVTLFQ